MKKRALFVDRHNAGLSQMAEALLTALGSRFYQVQSAGLQPLPISAAAIDAMRQIGIDISGHRPKPLAEFTAEQFDLVVFIQTEHTTNEVLPLPECSERMIWRLIEPGTDISDVEAGYVRARDELQQRIHFLLLTERTTASSDRSVP